ncbi:MAG: hypothetical protein ACLR06_12770 [Christensenellaceae bacterium]
MKKIAVIDIGSNSVRLMMMADGKVLYKTLDTTRLGEGLASSSLLKREAVERTAAAVAAFYARANAEGRLRSMRLRPRRYAPPKTAASSSPA